MPKSPDGEAFERMEQRTFSCETSALFVVQASDTMLRGLMAFIQQEGIAPQNTLSQMVGPNQREFRLWVNSEDERKVKNWLQENSFKS